MIAKGKTHSSGAKLADYMTTAKAGERVEMYQLRGFDGISDDIHEAFRAVDAMSVGTRSDKPLFHAYVRNRDGEHLTPEQWEYVADRIEKKLGLNEQPRAIAFHIDAVTGDRHMHVGWSRIDENTMTIIDMPFYKTRLKEVARELELNLGLEPVTSRRRSEVMAPSQGDDEQSRRLGVDIHSIRERIRQCWEQSDNGKSFAAALDDRGLTLAQGARRDFIVIDHEGGMHALGKRILGSTAGEVRARCSDLDRAALPTVDEAREAISTGMRDTHAAGLAWEDALAQAAIAKEKVEGRFAEPLPHVTFSLEEYERLAPSTLDSLTRTRATFTRCDLERALESEVEDRTNRVGMVSEILNHPGVVCLGSKDGPATRYTTTAVVEAEQHVLRAAAALTRSCHHEVPATLTNAKFQTITPEQQRALAHATGPEGLAIIDGHAGTGKSYTMAAIREAYEQQGFRVVGLAPTNVIAQDMKSDGFANARTLHSELFALNRAGEWTDRGRMSDQQLSAIEYNRKVQAHWNARTVVIVDEAAMIDTRHLSQLTAHAAATGAKMILIGDNRQLSSIERGGMFEVLKERHGCAELTEVRRQTNMEDRRASELMAQGDFAAAMEHYSDKGAIHWTERQSEAAEALVARWANDSIADPSKTRFVFAYTNDDVSELNGALRRLRDRRGELGTGQTFDTKHGSAEFATGDRIQFTGTDKLQGIFNGQAGTVQEIDGTRITVQLDGRTGRTVEFDAAEFQDFRHGYAGTIYKGQGRTIDQTYLYHSEHWRNSSTYVAMTRHSDTAELFVAREIAADLPELTRQVSRLDERRAASFFIEVQDFANEQPLTPAEVRAWYTNIDRVAAQNAAHITEADRSDDQTRNDDSERSSTEEQTDAKVEVSDAAQSKQEKREQQREVRDRRERSDREQVFQFLQSATGRDYRQR